MRILLFTHIYPPAIDGGSRVIAKIGEYLRQNRHQVMVLTSDCSSTDDFVNPGSPHRYFPPKAYINRLPVHKNLRRPLKILCFFLEKVLFINHKSYIIQLLDVFQKGPIFKLFPFLKAVFNVLSFRPDLIIAGPLPTTIVIYARFFQFLTKSKLLINASYHPTDAAFSQKPLTAALQHCTYIWGLTQFEKKYFETQLKINPGQIITVGNGIDSDLISDIAKNSLSHPPNLLFIGSFAAHKGLACLIDAFQLSLEKYPDLTLTLAGQSTLYSPTIETQIAKLSDSTRRHIKLVYNFHQNQLTDLIDSCTVLILPSAQESFGLVLLEAWARQKPVITSDIPALNELVTQTHGGLTFHTSQAVDLANQITLLLSQPIRLKLYGLNGYRYVKNHYTWDKIGHKLCQEIFP